ncbi:MAG TPA: L-2-amino-thiazoline-4-carboxylic acid hydrolase [Candidatus Methylomirabilis sp.]|nr:L-2-amino-thiazoline-4-carboxylic acid hydrolase [Candidatus Methylomirabilis sp.]
MKAMDMKIRNDDECKELIRFIGSYDAAILGFTVQAIMERYGEEGYNIIKEAMFRKGRLDASELKEHRITFGSFREFGMFFGTSLNGIVNSIISPKQKMEIVSENEVVLTHTACIRCSEWDKIGFADEMKLRLCDLYFGSFEAYMKEIFPEIRVIKEKLIPRGDNVCRIVFKK